MKKIKIISDDATCAEAIYLDLKAVNGKATPFAVTDTGSIRSKASAAWSRSSLRPMPAT